ncbi:hypothetical protein D3C78_1871780 [compost metagenome]
MKYIVGEIDIVTSISSSNIVLLVPALTNEFLELRNNMIVAAFSVNRLAKSVMNLFSSIQA